MCCVVRKPSDLVRRRGQDYTAGRAEPHLPWAIRWYCWASPRSGKSSLLDTPRPGDEPIRHTLMVRSPQAKVGCESAPSRAQVSALLTWSAFKTGNFTSPLLLKRKPNIHHSFFFFKKRKSIALNSGERFRVVKMQKPVSWAPPAR